MRVQGSSARLQGPAVRLQGPAVRSWPPTVRLQGNTMATSRKNLIALDISHRGRALDWRPRRARPHGSKVRWRPEASRPHGWEPPRAPHIPVRVKIVRFCPWRNPRARGFVGLAHPIVLPGGAICTTRSFHRFPPRHPGREAGIDPERRSDRNPLVGCTDAGCWEKGPSSFRSHGSAPER